MVLRVIDTKDQAVKTYQTFYAREHEREVPMKFGWPKKMQEIGSGGAEMYHSTKWKKPDDYKHVAEGSRTVFATPGFLCREHTSQKAKVVGPVIQFEEPMPKHFTVLGNLLGVQMRLYEAYKNGKGVFAKDSDDGCIEIRVAQGKLGAAKHPKTGEVFLFVYTLTGGVHMILTGGSLTIGKDGIAG